MRLVLGDGASRTELLRQREKLRLENVVMLEQQPRDRMPALWSLCDVAVVLLRRSPVLSTALPSKMLEAMAMGRPIIVAAEGEAGDLVEAAGAGLPVAPEDPKALAEAILQLVENPGLRQEFGIRGREWVEIYHDRRRLGALALGSAVFQGLGAGGRPAEHAEARVSRKLGSAICAEHRQNVHVDGHGRKPGLP